MMENQTTSSKALASHRPTFQSARLPPASRKGQYFSFDAIMASVIFVLALSLLSTHWFALRAQIDSSSDYLGTDALRVSDLLLGVGNPIYYPDAAAPADLNDCLKPGTSINWYLCPGQAQRAGFSVNNSLNVELNATQLKAAAQFIGLDPYAGQPPKPAPLNDHYNAYRSLLSLGSQFRLEVNTTHPCFGSLAMGRSPVNASEIVIVRRSIAIFDPNDQGANDLQCAGDLYAAGPGHYYYGNLTLYVWSNQTRS